MADTKISDLSALTALASTDELALVDKSDTSMAASGTDKKVTLTTLIGALGVPLLQSTGSVPSTTVTGTYWSPRTGANVIASGASATATSADALVLNSTDYPSVTNLEVLASISTTATQTGATFTLGLYSVVVSGTSNWTPTLTLVSGSTVAFVAPAAASEARGSSGAFAFPATNLYLLGLAISGASTAATSRVNFTVTLRTAV